MTPRVEIRNVQAHERFCNAEAFHAQTLDDFIGWGRRSTAWGLCWRLGMSFAAAVDVVDGDVDA